MPSPIQGRPYPPSSANSAVLPAHPHTQRLVPPTPPKPCLRRRAVPLLAAQGPASVGAFRILGRMTSRPDKLKDWSIPDRIEGWRREGRRFARIAHEEDDAEAAALATMYFVLALDADRFGELPDIDDD